MFIGSRTMMCLEREGREMGRVRVRERGEGVRGWDREGRKGE